MNETGKNGGEMSANKKSWNWDAIAAIATALTAIAAFLTILFDNHDAKDSRKQQQTMFQGNVISDCMRQYFAIRSQTARDWDPQSTNHVEQQKVQDLYSEQMSGLHFEEYHLFRQDAIPTHIYAIWVNKLKHEIQQPNQHYPPLNRSAFIGSDTNEDFYAFIRKVLDETNVDKLVEVEADKAPYK